MTENTIAPLDPNLDLVLERVIDVPRSLVWAAWTTPEQLVRWWAPAPWTTVACELDLRPGGRFYTVMRSPEGEDHPNAGCYLEIVAGERLVFTDTLTPGYRPSSSPFMTVVLTLADEGASTRYTARVLHADTATRDRHKEMGFFEGWGQCLDQLVGLVRSQQAGR